MESSCRKGEEGSSKVLKFGCWLLRRVRAPVFGRPVQRAGGQLRVQLSLAGDGGVCKERMYACSRKRDGDEMQGPLVQLPAKTAQTDPNSV